MRWDLDMLQSEELSFIKGPHLIRACSIFIKQTTMTWLSEVWVVLKIRKIAYIVQEEQKYLRYILAVYLFLLLQLSDRFWDVLPLWNCLQENDPWC
jgi:hypothetical protein